MTEASIGQLNTRLALEEPVVAIDSIGGATVSWSLKAQVWGAVRPLGAREIVAGERRQSEITHLIVLRWRAQVSPGMRLRDGERVFEIVSAVDPQGERSRLVCRCREIA
ncbi:MAG: phage head closure protein [Beijerinckiaceae bacterium]